MDLEQEEGRMHHLLALVGSGRAGRGRREERAQSGEAEGECEGENGERGGGGEDYNTEGWRERGDGNPSQFFWPLNACSRPARAKPPRNGIHFLFPAARLGVARCTPRPMPKTPYKHPNDGKLHPGGQAEADTRNQTRSICIPLETHFEFGSPNRSYTSERFIWPESPPVLIDVNTCKVN